MKESGRWKAVTAAILLFLLGAAILVSWAFTLRDGYLADGFWTVEGNDYLVFTLAVEILMAVLALVAGWALLARWWWGRIVALLSIGFMGYSTINTLGYSLHSAAWLTPIMVGGLAGALATLGLLWNREWGMAGKAIN